MVLNTTFYACFHVRVALLKCDFLRVPCTESWTSWAQMKAENLRNPKMVLHVPIAASEPRFSDITPQITDTLQSTYRLQV